MRGTCLTSLAASESHPAQISADARRAISRSVVSLLKEHLGRGPVKAKTYIHEDSVLVLMSDGHTTGEETLSEDGQGEAVASQRVKSSEAIRERLVAVIEAETGRRVVGYEQQPAGALAALLRLRPRFDRPLPRGLTPVGKRLDPAERGTRTIRAAG